MAGLARMPVLPQVFPSKRVTDIITLSKWIGASWTMKCSDTRLHQLLLNGMQPNWNTNCPCYSPILCCYPIPLYHKQTTSMQLYAAQSDIKFCADTLTSVCVDIWISDLSPIQCTSSLGYRKLFVYCIEMGAKIKVGCPEPCLLTCQYSGMGLQGTRGNPDRRGTSMWVWLKL